MFIGDKVRRLRESNNLTVKQLSQLSNVSQSYIREIESGVKDNVTVHKLDLLCKACNMNLVEFFSNDDIEDIKVNLSFYQRAIINLCYQLESDEAEIILKLLEKLLDNRKNYSSVKEVSPQ